MHTQEEASQQETHPASQAALPTSPATPVAQAKKAAFVAVVGRPSVGKSTLVNRLCKAKVAIVSPVPQTTRNAIRGILNDPRGQLVFVDTPGRHTSERKLNRHLLEVSDRALEDADLVLYVMDAARAPGAEEDAIAQRIAPFPERTVGALNKADSPAPQFEAYQTFLADHLPRFDPARCFVVSALKRQGLDALTDCLFDRAGQGDPLYPEDYYTDQDIPFRISEIIREKAVNRLYEELPHSIYVEVADLEVRGERLWVRAFIIAERESQKGMIVGKDGVMIKAIRQAAQKDLNRIFEWKVDLDLRVKAYHDWRHNDVLLKKLTR